MSGFYTIPATLPFADTFAQFVDEVAARQTIPSSVIKIYVPTRRSIRTLRDAFLRRSQGKPRLLPIIQAIGDSDSEEISFLTPHAPDIPPAIDSIRRQIVLARMLETAWTGDYNFTQALAVASGLGRLIDQMHTEGLNFDALDTLVDIREFSEHWEITLSFLRNVLQQAWPAYLRDTGLIDAGLHRRLRIDALTQFYIDHPPATPVMIAGSTGSHPATRRLIKTIGAKDQGYIILPALDTVMDETAWIAITDGHPQALMKKLISHCGVLRQNIKIYTPNTPNESREFLISEIMRPAVTTGIWQGYIDTDIHKKITAGTTGLSLCCAANEEIEARSIGLMMAEIAADPAQEKTCVLITPDRGIATRVKSALTQWGIICDDSAGQNITQTPIGRYALSILEAEQDGQIHPVPFLACLKSPLAGGNGITDFRSIVRTLDRDVLRGVRPSGTIADLISHTDYNHNAIRTLAAIFAPLTQHASDECTLGEWITAHLTVMESLATTPDMDGASRLWIGHEGETLAIFLENLQTHSSGVPRMNRADYHDFLRTMMESVQTRPPYGTHPRLAILGQIEARMTRADRVIVAGLNEGIWPPEAGFDAWMSRPMRADLGLPSLAQKTTLASHDFSMALGGAEVFITYAERKGGQPVLPSRWIQRLETLLAAAKIDRDHWPDRHGYRYLQWAHAIRTPSHIESLPRPQPCPDPARRPVKFSVTDIEKWMRDPYHLYAKRVLRLRKLKNVDEDVSAADRGTLIHAAMEEFTKTYSGATLPEQPLDALLTIGTAVFAAQADNPEIHGLWWPRFEKAAAWMVDHEREWRKGTSVIYAERECAHSLTVNGIDYILTGKADRIERRIGNDWAIIDYKTGNIPKPGDVAAGIANQLTIEAHILNENGFDGLNGSASDTIGIYYWNLGGGGTGGEAKPAQGTQKAKSTQTLAAEAGEGLRHLIETFQNADIPYIGSPDPDIMITAAHNDYAHLERIAEWSVIGDAEDAA